MTTMPRSRPKKTEQAIDADHERQAREITGQPGNQRTREQHCEENDRAGCHGRTEGDSSKPPSFGSRPGPKCQAHHRAAIQVTSAIASRSRPRTSPTIADTATMPINT